MMMRWIRKYKISLPKSLKASTHFEYTIEGTQYFIQGWSKSGDSLTITFVEKDRYRNRSMR